MTQVSADRPRRRTPRQFWRTLITASHHVREVGRKVATESPARFAVGVFAGLILVFTFLLWMPASSGTDMHTSFVDALFTAVSTICVTGLSTVDMGTHWSALGHVIIYIGVNVGAMGVLTLASILGMAISKRLGLRARLMAASDSNPLRVHGGPVNEGQTIRLGEVGSLLATVGLATLFIELALAILMLPSLLIGGIPLPTALWQAPYYAAMTFTNTGFTPAEGLFPFLHDYFFLTLMMVGVFLGSIGFPVIYTLYRHRWHVHAWSLHAKLTIITTIVLFVIGAGVFLALEYDNPATFGTGGAFDTVFQSFFLSGMTRSGGFSTVDIGSLHGSSLIVGSMLMFVGGGSASTAGGIKVTTLAVLALAVWSEAKGRPSVQVFGKRIPSDVQRVAVSVVAWGATIVAVSTVTIAQITKAPVADVLFDVTSGFATVGLSTGLTETLPPSAKYVMIATIFMGRVGTVTLAAAIAATSRSQLYALPTERPIVG